MKPEVSMPPARLKAQFAKDAGYVPKQSAVPLRIFVHRSARQRYVHLEIINAHYLVGFTNGTTIHRFSGCSIGVQLTSPQDNSRKNMDQRRNTDRRRALTMGKDDI